MSQCLKFARLPRQQRHEADRDQAFAREARLRLGKLDNVLRPVVRAHGQQHHAPIGKLVEQRLRDGLGSRGDDDPVKGRPRRNTGEAVAGHDLDIVIAERRQPFARAVGKLHSAVRIRAAA